MTYRGIVTNGVVVLEGEKPADGTLVDVMPRELPRAASSWIVSRLAELRGLKNGWLEGRGQAPNPTQLNWLANAFAHHWPADLPEPYLYPTPEGGILAEWSVSTAEASLEIDLANAIGDWHCLDVKSSRTAARQLDLNAGDSWIWLASQIRELGAGAA